MPGTKSIICPVLRNWYCFLVFEFFFRLSIAGEVLNIFYVLSNIGKCVC